MPQLAKPTRPQIALGITLAAIVAIQPVLTTGLTAGTLGAATGRFLPALLFFYIVVAAGATVSQKYGSAAADANS